MLASRGDFGINQKTKFAFAWSGNLSKVVAPGDCAGASGSVMPGRKLVAVAFSNPADDPFPPRFAQTRQQRNFYSSSSVLIKRKSTTTPSTHVFPTSFCDKNLSSFVFPFCVLMLVLVTRQFGYFNSEARKETGEALYIPHPHSPLV